MRLLIVFKAMPLAQGKSQDVILKDLCEINWYQATTMYDKIVFIVLD